MRMRKFVIHCRTNIPQFPFVIIFGLLAIFVLAISNAPVNARENVGATPMHKVQLTQKGYIQFLRWELPVPEIQEFTFCLWVKSRDLKYPHSIFSYSKNERERLIRSWISSGGRSIHLEINDVEVFQSPTRILEHRWYHICQSWENRVGRYALWLNGYLELQGHNEKMIDHVIPDGGDIVLGQEYTDFDKGLEEGIEGTVLGFNLLLASAFNSLDHDYQSPSFDPVLEAPNFQLSSAAEISSTITKQESDLDAMQALGRFLSRRYTLNPVSWFRKILRSERKEAVESSASNSLPLDLLNIANDTWKEETSPAGREAITFDIDDSTREIGISGESPDVPLGLQLVKMSYVHCQLGRGSPSIGGPLMLISWSRTPVKVFGGAIIKNAKNECGNF